MENSMLVLKPKKHLGSVQCAFETVVEIYFDYLINIAYVVKKELTQDTNKEKRHFRTIKNELSKFLQEHKSFYQLKAVNIMSVEGLIVNSLKIHYEDTFEKMIRLDDLKAFCENTISYKTLETIHYEIYIPDKKIVERDCSTYKELEGRLNSRFEKYLNETINNFLIRDVYYVINTYLKFLFCIVYTISEGPMEMEREKRKFKAVKKELFEFLLDHKTYFDLSPVCVYSKSDLFLTLDINSLNNFDEFLKLEDFKAVVEIEIDTEKFLDLSYSIYPKEQISNKFKNVKETFNTSNKHILRFLHNRYLVDKNNFSTYKQLKAYLECRIESYAKKEISPVQISHMSFTLQRLSTVEEKSCGVCLDDYEVDQEVCRLPCNHFCCRSCTEKMFAISDDGSEANFQCPICRDDCT